MANLSFDLNVFRMNINGDDADESRNRVQTCNHVADNPCACPANQEEGQYLVGTHSVAASQPANGGFVKHERQATRSLIVHTLTCGIALSTVNAWIVLDRYQYGPWTYLTLSLACLASALSVYYAQAVVVKLGVARVLILSLVSMLFYTIVHFSSSILLYQLGVIVMALFLGPFYAIHYILVSSFTSTLVFLTSTIKRSQEERYARLFHTLLLCPSLIVGYAFHTLVFIGVKASRHSSDVHSLPSGKSQ